MDGERDRLVRLAVRNGRSLGEIGRLLGVSRQRAHAICRRLNLTTAPRWSKDCAQCGSPFVTVHADATLCSPECRLQHRRARRSKARAQ